MKQKQSKDPFGTIRVAHKALSKIRELQRGVPPPYGEAFSMETLIPDQLAARHLRPEPRPELALIASP
ncbi:TPA: hypothetical protein ACH3X1_015149 [Trebouxia sp. C0004]